MKIIETILNSIPYFLYNSVLFYAYFSIIKFKFNILLTSICCSLLNSLFLSIIFYSMISYHLLYLHLFIFYFITMFIFSKGHFRTLLVTSTTFYFNLIAVNIIIVLLFALNNNIHIIDVYENIDYFFTTFNYSCLALFIELYIVKHIFGDNRLTLTFSSKIYSELLICVNILLTTLISYDFYFLVYNPDYIYYLPQVIITVILAIIFFMCFFIFNVSNIKMYPYKRKAEEVSSIYRKLLEKRNVYQFRLNVDDLTELYNRRFIDAKLDELCKNHKNEFACIYLDIVGLKKVNDKFGHVVGDNYIKNIANALKQATRESDFIGRLAGDEFFIILNNTNQAGLDNVLDKITIKVDQLNDISPHYVGINYGTLVINRNFEVIASDIIDRADKAMLKNKSFKGGN